MNNNCHLCYNTRMNAVFCLSGKGLVPAGRRTAALLHSVGINSTVIQITDVCPVTTVSAAVKEPGWKRDETLILTDSPDAACALIQAGWYVAGIMPEGEENRAFEGVAFVFTQIDLVDPDSYVKAYERLAGLPWQILTTDRLLVRETTPEDVDRFYEIYAPPEMTRYMEGLFSDPADERRYMEDYIRNVYSLLGFGVWTLVEKESGTVIGRAGFSIRNGFDNPELGFLIGVPWQRRGFATEACRAILDYGREVLEFKRVLAFVREGNDVSIKLCKSLGFVRAKDLELEERIYGDSYGGEGSRVPADRAAYGRYIQMVCDMRAKHG